MIKSRKEKLLWNDAIKEACSEIKKWDGLIPNDYVRKFMATAVYERLAYKIKK